ncbi:MAG: M48 family metalloprotease [Pseudomonadales bacterium]|nr:M48 family metalloprotease [Pseudomonadales bacterium]
MNFFEAQDNARRKTWQLGLMFGAAVVTLVVLTNVLVAVFFGWTGTQAGLTFEETLTNIPIDSWFWISGGVLGIVALASLYKYIAIQGGGRAIAESLGGNLIPSNTRDPKHRQLLNVVEEMAIASGIAVPPVYLIPESSINAFAAGFTPEDAIVGFNQGTLDHLTRAELQGVVAHEFSHILNGDTSINLRLIAILHGILFIGMIGYGLLRAGGYSRKNGMPILALGVGLLAIGYGGTFFGNMIKAGVSRQREYLADASAVQFTRDPSGIADALKKIGGLSDGSIMTNQNAEQSSHMFFGSVAKKFSGLFSTHPPLDQRIRAIEPNWRGDFQQVGDAQPFAASTNDGPFSQFSQSSPALSASSPEEVVDHIGRPNETNLAIAHQLIADNDAGLNDAAHDPFEARALVYCMLLDHDETIASKQLAYLDANAEPGVPEHVRRLVKATQATDAIHQLTLLGLSVPALKTLSKPQYSRFTQNAAKLITADGHVDVFEWVVHRLLIKDLHAHFVGPTRTHGRIGKITKVAKDASKLLSILASHSQDELEDQLAAYNAGAKALGIKAPFSKQEFFDYERMNAALGHLRELKPLLKPQLIKACASTVMHDGKLNVAEFALMQGIAATLDCPLPPSVYET